MHDIKDQSFKLIKKSVSSFDKYAWNNLERDGSVTTIARRVIIKESASFTISRKENVNFYLMCYVHI